MMICSTAVQAKTYSEQKVTVLMVACFLEYQSIGILFNTCRVPVNNFPDCKLCIRFVSTYVEALTALPSSCGMSEGKNSLEYLYTIMD